MTTAADIIAALNRRRLSIRPAQPGALPPGWQQWLEAAPPAPGGAQGARASAVVDVFLQRPLRAVPRAPGMLGRLQAFGRLLEQEWTPARREERPLRVGVGAFDILLHLVLAALLLWLMYLRFIALAQPQEDEEGVVQVEFIGRGNIEQGGGAPANAGAQAAAAAAAAPRATAPAPASGRPDAAIERVDLPSPPTVAASSETPQRIRDLPLQVAEVEAPSPQPLAVAEVAREPEPEVFQLPSPRQLEAPQHHMQVREVEVRQAVEAVPALPVQQQQVLQPREAQSVLRMPELREQPRELEVVQPMPAVQARSLPADPGTARVRVPDLRGEVRELPLPPSGNATVVATQAGGGSAARGEASGGAGTQGEAPSAGGQAAAGSGDGQAQAAQGGRGVAATGAGAGPVNRPAPGGWPGPAKSDDWGAAKRNAAGTGLGDGQGRSGNGDGKRGLFDEDGRPRLSDEWTEVTGLDLDRAGTWLKRPGLEYRGTRFDQYWIPEGTLLQEWVRRGIRKVSIPIPGSKRRLECVVSLLQFGGGCFPVNPDANDQPARARPAPDIPFKPELQEDNGSVAPASAIP